MSPSRPSLRACALLCAPLLTVGLAACGGSVSTGSFKGEEHEVAQTIANLQTHATAGDQAKVCSEDLAASVVSRLGGTAACEHAIKSQLTETDNLEVSVDSVTIDTATKTATAKVTSTYSGKRGPGTMTLVKEGDRWKVSGVSHP